MTPQEALDRALQMLVSPEFEPVIGEALNNAKSPAIAAATLVFPIIVRLQQETDFPDEEMFGNEEGDGIAAHLLQEVINIAGESGYLPEEGNEEMARALGDEAVEALSRLLDEADIAASSASKQQQNPMAMAGPPQQQAPGGLLEVA